MVISWKQIKFLWILVLMSVLATQQAAQSEEDIQTLCHQGLANRNQYLDSSKLAQLETSLQAGKVQKQIANKVVWLIGFVAESIPPDFATIDKKSVRILMFTIDASWIAIRKMISLAAYDVSKKKDILEGFRIVYAELGKALDALSRLPADPPIEKVQEVLGVHRACLRTMVELSGDPNISGNLVCPFSKDKELTQQIQKLSKEVPSKIDKAFYWATRSQNIALVRSTLESVRKDLQEDAQKLVQALQGEFAKKEQERKALLGEIRLSRQEKKTLEMRVTELQRKVSQKKASPSEANALVESSMRIGRLTTEIETQERDLEEIQRFLNLATGESLYFCEDPPKGKK